MTKKVIDIDCANENNFLVYSGGKKDINLIAFQSFGNLFSGGESVKKITVDDEKKEIEVCVTDQKDMISILKEISNRSKEYGDLYVSGTSNGSVFNKIFTCHLESFSTINNILKISYTKEKGFKSK